MSVFLINYANVLPGEIFRLPFFLGFAKVKSAGTNYKPISPKGYITYMTIALDEDKQTATSNFFHSVSNKPSQRQMSTCVKRNSTRSES